MQTWKSGKNREKGDSETHDEEASRHYSRNRSDRQRKNPHAFLSHLERLTVVFLVNDAIDAKLPGI